MDNHPTIKANIAYGTALQVLNLAVPLVTAPYVSRVLGAANLGIYSYTSSIAAYFILLASLGTANYGMREIARVRDDSAACARSFWGIEAMVVATTLASTALWLLASVAYSDYGPYLLALTPSVLATAFDISWLFMGLEQMNRVVIRNAAVKLVGMALMFALVRSSDDLIVYALVNSTVQLLGNLSMWAYLPGVLDRIPLRELEVGRHFRASLAYFVPAVMTSVYTVLDKTMIGVITADNLQNGYYAQADKVVAMAKAVSFASLNAVMGSRMSYLFAQEGADGEIRMRIDRSLDLVLLVTACFAFGIAGLAGPFVPVFFGEGYGPVVPLLRAMCPVIVIIGVSGVLLSHYLTPAGLINRATAMIASGAALNFALNLALIPSQGTLGAVAATLAAESLITALFLLGSRGWYSARRLAAGAVRKAVAGAAMLAFLALLCRSGLEDAPCLAIGILVGPAVYALALAAMRDTALRFLAAQLSPQLKARRAVMKDDGGEG